MADHFVGILLVVSLYVSAGGLAMSTHRFFDGVKIPAINGELQARLLNTQSSTGRNIVAGDGTTFHVSPNQVIADFTEDYVLLKGNQIGHKREKRQATTPADHVIEILFVVDSEAYRKWLNLYNGNETKTEEHMKIFYHWIIRSLNQRYSHVAKESKVIKSLKFKLTGLIILKRSSDSAWTESSKFPTGFVNITEALEKLTIWVNQRTDLPSRDHVMAFSGYNLQKGTNVEAKGLAALGGMCTEDSFSIIEDDMTSTVASVAAHEIGHSIGATHDREAAGCSDDDNYIMTTKLRYPTSNTQAPRLWQFSSCSIRKFEETLSSVTCTSENPFTPDTVEPGSVEDVGQFFTADQQCKMGVGLESDFGRSIHALEGHGDMCRGMYCEASKGPKRTTFTVRIPLDGTSCGFQKWCEQGQCVSNAEAPSRPDNCPQGNLPLFNCVQSECINYSARIRTAACCETCPDSQVSVNTPIGSTTTTYPGVRPDEIVTTNVIGGSILVEDGPLPRSTITGTYPGVRPDEIVTTNVIGGSIQVEDGHIPPSTIRTAGGNVFLMGGQPKTVPEAQGSGTSINLKSTINFQNPGPSPPQTNGQATDNSKDINITTPEHSIPVNVQTTTTTPESQIPKISKKTEPSNTTMTVKSSMKVKGLDPNSKQNIDHGQQSVPDPKASLTRGPMTDTVQGPTTNSRGPIPHLDRRYYPMSNMNMNGQMPLPGLGIFGHGSSIHIGHDGSIRMQSRVPSTAIVHNIGNGIRLSGFFGNPGASVGFIGFRPRNRFHNKPRNTSRVTGMIGALRPVPKPTSVNNRQYAPRPRLATRVAPRPSVGTGVAPRPSVATRVAPKPSVAMIDASKPSFVTRVAPRPSVAAKVAPRPLVAKRINPNPPIANDWLSQMTRGFNNYINGMARYMNNAGSHFNRQMNAAARSINSSIRSALNGLGGTLGMWHLG
ncbi:uncharacterized protein LOC126821040 [Patella vulgata]|uniref:uncharacterized protein LOC126821040 n=1 Tax=Patella vulgata TaxID=6465 RepID=UPI0021800A48|nr:uncharacterized protein LOC126821040 [Patella vulgata]